MRQPTRSLLKSIAWDGSRRQSDHGNSILRHWLINEEGVRKGVCGLIRAVGYTLHVDWLQFRNAKEVVSRCCQNEQPVHFTEASQLHLFHSGDRFHPPEGAFDQGALLLADCITGVPSGPSINGAVLLLRHMRSDLDRAQCLHKIFDIIAFVGPCRDGASAAPP